MLLFSRKLSCCKSLFFRHLSVISQLYLRSSGEGEKKGERGEREEQFKMIGTEGEYGLGMDQETIEEEAVIGQQRRPLSSKDGASWIRSRQSPLVSWFDFDNIDVFNSVVPFKPELVANSSGFSFQFVSSSISRSTSSLV
jgi:hypothetical protein